MLERTPKLRPWMRHDLTNFLRKWDYQPGELRVRRFKGRDGRPKIQLRVDLGVLQMEAEGRQRGSPEE